MRTIYIILIGFTAAGCAQREEVQPSAAVLMQQSDAAIQACDAKVPKGNPKTAVARAKCIVDAEGIRRPIMTYPDLWDAMAYAMIANAEQVERGQITIAQGNEVIVQKRAELAAEEQRRKLANRSAAAPEGVAAASIMVGARR